MSLIFWIFQISTVDYHYERMNIYYLDNFKIVFLNIIQFYSRDCTIRQQCSMANIKGSVQLERVLISLRRTTVEYYYKRMFCREIKLLIV